MGFVAFKEKVLKKSCLDTPCNRAILGWWFQIFFIFTPIWGRFPILTIIFFKGGTNGICFATNKTGSMVSSHDSCVDELFVKVEATQMDGSRVGFQPVEKGGFTKTSWRIPIIQL